MTECPIHRHPCFPWLKEESDFASCHAQLSVRGKQVLDRLLVLLPSHLKSRFSSFPPALLFSICDALQLDHADNSVEQNEPAALPIVLSKLRDWRLLDPDDRYSPGAIHRLALDLAKITDEAPTSTNPDLDSTSHLRIKWVGSDQESSWLTPPSPGVLGSAQECAHALPDLNECRSYESWQGGRLGTPDSEDAGAAVSPRYHSLSGFRSGCSACRHLRLSGPASNPPSPRMTSVPFNDVKQSHVNIDPDVLWPRHPKSSARHVLPRKTRHESPPSHVDENEPPTYKPIAVQHGTGISFPRHSPRISNALLPRELFSPVRRPLDPSRLLNQDRQGDKHTTSPRLASVDLGLSMANPRRNYASPNDLHPHPPTRAQSFSHTPVKSHGVGSVGNKVPKPSSNAVGPRSSKRLPSWTQTHPTTTSVQPVGSMSPPAAKAGLANQRPRPSDARSRPSSTPTPRSLASDRGAASSHRHKHTSSVGVLPLSPASPSVHARKWQV